MLQKQVRTIVKNQCQKHITGDLTRTWPKAWRTNPFAVIINLDLPSPAAALFVQNPALFCLRFWAAITPMKWAAHVSEPGDLAMSLTVAISIFIACLCAHTGL